MSNKINFLLFDWMNLVKRYFAINNTEEMNFGDFIDTHLTHLLNRFINIITTIDNHVVIICSDCGINKRAKAILPNYKANRKKYTTLSLSENEQNIYEYLNDVIKTLPIPFIEVNNVEADLLIYLSKQYISKYLLYSDKVDYSFTIVSGDSDFIQLLDDKTLLYNYKNVLNSNDWYDNISYIKEELDVKYYTLLKALVGDTSDNIKGVPGFGWKRAIKLINILQKPDISTINDIIIQMDKFINDINNDKKDIKWVSKYLDIIKENKNDLEKNFMVIDLSMIETTSIFKCLKTIEKEIFDEKKFDQKKFGELLHIEDRFNNNSDDEDTKIIVSNFKKNIYMINNKFGKQQKIINILEKVKKSI